MNVDLTKSGISFLQLERKRRDSMHDSFWSDFIVISGFVILIAYVLSTLSMVV